MKNFKKIMPHLSHMLIGSFVSSFIYVISLVSEFNVPDLNFKNSLIIVLLGALIGLYSGLFDIEKLSFLTALICHFCLTLLSVLGSLYLFQSSFSIIQSVGFLGSFLMIYIFIWLGVSVYLYLSVRQINRKLRDNRHKNKF